MPPTLPLIRPPTAMRALLALLAGTALPVLAQDGADRSLAAAQAQPAPPAQAQPPAAPRLRRIDIGSATERLLSLQSDPRQAHAPRPIEGEQARRSYARYLKSFETDIPPLYKTGSDSGGRN